MKLELRIETWLHNLFSSSSAAQLNTFNGKLFSMRLFIARFYFFYFEYFVVCAIICNLKFHIIAWILSMLCNTSILIASRKKFKNIVVNFFVVVVGIGIGIALPIEFLAMSKLISIVCSVSHRSWAGLWIDRYLKIRWEKKTIEIRSLYLKLNCILYVFFFDVNTVPQSVHCALFCRRWTDIWCGTNK